MRCRKIKREFSKLISARAMLLISSLLELPDLQQRRRLIKIVTGLVDAKVSRRFMYCFPHVAKSDALLARYTSSSRLTTLFRTKNVEANYSDKVRCFYLRKPALRLPFAVAIASRATFLRVIFDPSIVEPRKRA